MYDLCVSVFSRSIYYPIWNSGDPALIPTMSSRVATLLQLSSSADFDYEHPTRTKRLPTFPKLGSPALLLPATE